MTRLDLGPAWGALGLVKGHASELQARELDIVQVGGRSPFVAIDWEGHRHLLVPMVGDIQASTSERGRCQGDHAGLVDQGETRRFLDVACLKPHLNGLFDVVGADMLAACSGSDLDRVPVACRGVLERWRELLEEIGSGQLSTSVLVGAWGELWFVRELLQRGAHWPGLWVGPSGAIHDIVGAGGSLLEVKTTMARGPLFVEIHGIHQLDSPDGARLLLGVLRLAHDEKGESLGDLVRASVALGANHAELMALLAHAGITTGAPQYEVSHFKVAEQRMYEVGGDFPRIVPGPCWEGVSPRQSSTSATSSISPPIHRFHCPSRRSNLSCCRWLAAGCDDASALHGAVRAERKRHGRGVINQLGRPSLDIHSLLIRETVQNSWDARLLDWGDVRFSVDVWTPNRLSVQSFGTAFSPSCPTHSPWGTSWTRSACRPTIRTTCQPFVRHL